MNTMELGCNLDADELELLECIEEIDRWMSSNRLKLNGDKTQFIWLGTRQQLARVDRRPLMVGGVQIAPLDMVRNRGVLLDDELTMASNINSVVRGCFFQLRQLRSVQRSLTRDTKVIVHAFVASKIDYCNSLLYGTLERVLHPMQVVLNAAARLVVGACRRDHITPILCELHWLPIRKQILYKMAVLAFHCIHQSAPTYLSEMFTSSADVHGRCHPRSADCCEVTKRYGPRSFRSAGPTVWNSLPCELRDKEITLSMFGRKLKTFLFSQVFS